MIIPYQTAQVSFKKQQRIGENGENSEVYVVHDEHLDAELVIKQVKTDGFNEERYLLEAQLLYKSVHPYVVRCCTPARMLSTSTSPCPITAEDRFRS